MFIFNRNALGFVLGLVLGVALFSPNAWGEPAQEQHRLVFAVQIHVDGLKDKVIYFTEAYQVIAYDQAQLTWREKDALRKLRELGAVGDLEIQTSCGVGK